MRACGLCPAPTIALTLTWQPLLSFAAGVADEAEGEALAVEPALLIRFGHLEDLGHDVL